MNRLHRGWIQSKTILTQYELEVAKIYHARRSNLLSKTDPDKLTPHCVTNILTSSKPSFNKCNDNMSFIPQWSNSSFEPDEKQVENHPILFPY